MVAVRVKMVIGKSDDREGKGREGKGRKRRARTVAKTDASRHLDRELAHSRPRLRLPIPIPLCGTLALVTRLCSVLRLRI